MIFKNKDQFFRELSPRELEARRLSSSLKLLFYPFVNERDYFIDKAFPDLISHPITSESSNYDKYMYWQPPSRQGLSPDDVKQLLHDVASDLETLDSITEKIFEISTFFEFVDFVNQTRGTDQMAASEATIESLRSLEPLDAWRSAIATTRPPRPILEWLEDLGDRMSTHSSIGEIHRVHRGELAPFSEAARIGFVAIDFALGIGGSRFWVYPSAESGNRLVGDACSPRASVPRPLDVVNPEIFKVVSILIDAQIRAIETIAGDPPVEKFYFSSDPVPFSTSIWATAHTAALMAAIGHDPSGCLFYEGLFFDKMPKDPRSAEWYMGSH